MPSLVLFGPDSRRLRIATIGATGYLSGQAAVDDNGRAQQQYCDENESELVHILSNK
jgi:hypothetical protein